MKETKEQLPVALDLPGAAQVRKIDWGGTAVAFAHFSPGVDATPLLEGLPNDLCPCPHWGYILEGAIQVDYGDGRQEVCRAGDVFYWPPGHTVRTEQDCRFVEFSPSGQLADVYGHLVRKASGQS